MHGARRHQQAELSREHVERQLLDLGDQVVEVQVVVAQRVRERLQDVGAQVADRLAQRVVLEQVAEDRQLDAEDLALQRPLQSRQEEVQPVYDRGRVGQQGEDAWQVRAEVAPVGCPADGERERARRVAEEQAWVDADVEGEDVLAWCARSAEHRVVDRELEARGADVDREDHADQRRGRARRRLRRIATGVRAV